MINQKFKTILISCAILFTATNIKAVSLKSAYNTPPGFEIKLVPQLNLNDKKKKEDKLQWHRTPARIPIMLYLDDHTLYIIGNDDCYPITIEVKDEQEPPIALYTIPDNKTEPIVLPESWNGRFKILVSYCERIYEGHIDLTR